MKKQEIYLWGFVREDVAHWPQVFEPVPVTALPEAQPVLVHYRALADFQSQALAHLRPDGRLPDALLYLPKKIQPPPDVRTFFDATVREGEWAELQKLFACPQRFKLEEMADELPGPFLSSLTGPVHRLSPSRLPLPSDVVAHLTDCPTCLEAFYQALKERLHWRRQLHWPSPAQLEAYFQGVADGRIAAHLAICAACRRELALLEQAHKDTVSPPWFHLIFPARQKGPGDWMEERAAALQQSLQAGWKQGVEALLGALQGAQMQPSYATGLAASKGGSGARVRRISAATPEPAQLLERLRQDGEVHFIGANRSLLLAWDEERGLLSLQELRGEGQQPLPAFVVSLWQDGEEVWTAQSQAGVVGIPVESLAAGVDEMRICDSASSI